MKRSSWEKREVFIAVAIGLRIRNVSVCLRKVENVVVVKVECVFKLLRNRVNGVEWFGVKLRRSPCTV